MDKQYDDQGIAVHFLICVDANEKKRCIVWPSGIYKARLKTGALLDKLVVCYRFAVYRSLAFYSCMVQQRGAIYESLLRRTHPSGTGRVISSAL